MSSANIFHLKSFSAFATMKAKRKGAVPDDHTRRSHPAQRRDICHHIREAIRDAVHRPYCAGTPGAFPFLPEHAHYPHVNRQQRHTAFLWSSRHRGVPEDHTP